MIKIIRYVLFLFLVVSTILAAGDVKFDGKNYYFANKLRIKLAQAPTSSTEGSVTLPASLSKELERFGVTEIKRSFQTKNTRSEAANELSKAVTLTFNSPYNVKVLAAKISKLREVEVAEPYYLDQLAYEPNDPNISQQYHISIIHAFSAWDVTKGDASTLIAINDTGVDWDHPDLAANIYENTAEANGQPGVDDDNNGFIDDIRGWDFGGLSGTPDNDPMEDRPDHGTHVAGDAAQVTDNGVNGAGIGFNCSILPVKTSQDNIRSNSGTALIAHGYAGIVYAADNGAKITNCSWGGYYYSRINQDVINYALEQNMLVVAAAGNDNTTDSHYPSSYDGVLSVASTTSTDAKSSFSNYGLEIDVAAPGSGVYSTWQNDTYITLGGTSMASPIVAGLAGLVATQFPNYNAMQIGEQIRVTTEDISSINPNYNHLIGTGRIDAAAAVSNTGTISVRANTVHFVDQSNGNGVFEPGETVAMEVNFTNYLNATSNLSISIEHSSNLVTVNNGTFSAGAKSTLEEFNNSGNLFTFTVSPNAPANSKANILIKYEDGDYQDYQWASIVLNPTYATQSGNDVQLTITSRGGLGFNDFSDNLQGDGFKFEDGENLLFEGGLMIGTSDEKVMDIIRGANPDNPDNDFKTVQGFLIETPGVISDQQGYGIFTDENAGIGKIGLKVDLHAFSFASEPNNKSMVLKYVIRNTSGSTISGLHAGLFFDWDIDEANYDNNVAAWDADNNFGYSYNQDQSAINTHVGVGLISSEDYNFYPMDNQGTLNIYSDFTTAEKWTTLSSGTSITSAGPADISMIVAGGPYTIANDDFVDVAFVISADTNLAGLQASVAAAKSLYGDLVTSVSDNNNSVPTEYSISQNYPNPFNPTTSISYSLPEVAFVKIKVFDILGREVSTLVNGEQSAGTHSIKFDASKLSSGIYFYSIETPNYTNIKKMMLVK